MLKSLQFILREVIDLTLDQRFGRTLKSLLVLPMNHAVRKHHGQERAPPSPKDFGGGLRCSACKPQSRARRRCRSALKTQPKPTEKWCILRTLYYIACLFPHFQQRVKINDGELKKTQLIFLFCFENPVSRWKSPSEINLSACFERETRNTLEVSPCAQRQIPNPNKPF